MCGKWRLNTRRSWMRDKILSSSLQRASDFSNAPSVPLALCRAISSPNDICPPRRRITRSCWFSTGPEPGRTGRNTSNAPTWRRSRWCGLGLDRMSRTDVGTPCFGRASAAVRRRDGRWALKTAQDQPRSSASSALDRQYAKRSSAGI